MLRFGLNVLLGSSQRTCHSVPYSYSYQWGRPDQWTPGHTVHRGGDVVSWSHPQFCKNNNDQARSDRGRSVMTS